MLHPLRRIKASLIALIALALSASLAFGAEPPAAASWGLANAASHSGKTVPVAGAQAGEEEGTEEEEEVVEEETDEDGEEAAEGEESEESGDHCATDPTLLTEEELAAMNHGAIVCWAAHQTEWPEEFKNHGAWVKSWAQSGKDDGEETDEDDTEDVEGDTTEATDADTDASPTRGNGKGKGKHRD